MTEWDYKEVCRRTYLEVVVHVPREDGVIIVRTDKVGGGVPWLLSKLILKPLLVADVHLLPLGLQEADESLDHPQC